MNNTTKVSDFPDYQLTENSDSPHQIEDCRNPDDRNYYNEDSIVDSIVDSVND